MGDSRRFKSAVNHHPTSGGQVSDASSFFNKFKTARGFSGCFRAGNHRLYIISYSIKSDVSNSAGQQLIFHLCQLAESGFLLDALGIASGAFSISRANLFRAALYDSRTTRFDNYDRSGLGNII